MRILLYGGSFDPPHAGHASLLAAAIARLRPDAAYVVPALRSPGKAAPEASAADRLAMARAAFRGPRVRVDAFELRRARPTYTYELIRHMRARHPGAELWALAGSDAFASIGSWRRPRELTRACRWAVGRRPGAALRTRPGALILPGTFPDVSSSGLRARLLAGEGVSGSVPAAVRAVIGRRRLYGGALRARLARGLAPERWRHTLAVAAMARELAQRHGLDAEKAALAGLLHDCGRALPVSEMVRRAPSLGVPFAREIARRQPVLLHAFFSERLARRVHGVRDREVLSAVGRHTFGAARMAPLERLLYVADACSRDRSFPEAASIRRAAQDDLGEALREAVRVKLACALREGYWIHPSGVALWNGLA